MGHRACSWAVALLAMALIPTEAIAEVSAGSAASKPSVVCLTGGNDPGPTPGAYWGLIRTGLYPELALNPTGDVQLDGAASTGIEPLSHRAVLVWSRLFGAQYELVQARWDGQQWTSPERLTFNESDDLDPEIVIDSDGNQHITWWRSGNPASVWYMRRSSTGSDPEENVTALIENGRSSTVSHLFGPRVAYQITNGGTNEVRVAHRDESWTSRSIDQTSYGGPRADGDIDVQIHSRDLIEWVDWVQADHLMGFSTFNPSTDTWSAPQYRPYTWDPAQGTDEWIAREMARVAIRLELIQQ